MLHGGCYFWRPELVWLHVSSDALIVLAYLMIPSPVGAKTQGSGVHWMLVMFGAFILACWATHFMNVWNIWHSAYRLEDSGAAVDHEALPDVSMDETQLKQLFKNLIGNAVKYRRPEEPLKISVAAESSNGRWLFAVKDNGIGIESQYFGQIFEAFKRLHGKEYPGSGVGLTICKKIVESSGGRMWVESELGQGCTFKFTLPAASRG